MSTLYRRDLWKKKALFGYSLEFVNAQIESKQEQFNRELKELELSLEALKKENDRLKDEKNELQAERAARQTSAEEQELVDQLAFTFMQGMRDHFQLKEELEEEKKELLKTLDMKKSQRDLLVKRLKTKINDLNLEASEMGEE